jgi:hypothetical protein
MHYLDKNIILILTSYYSFKRIILINLFKMTDDFSNEIEKLKRDEKKLKSEITKRNDFENKGLPTSLVIYTLTIARCRHKGYIPGH